MSTPNDDGLAALATALNDPLAVAKPKSVTTRDINDHMASVFSEAAGYACLFEVANGTGSNASRSADIVVFNLWPSRGMDLNGYEVKTARSDWLRELKQPEKAWPVMQYMDRWWLIASPGVAKPDEIPTNWGFMEFNGMKTRVIKPAPKLEAKPLSKSFVGAMLRKPIRNVESMVARRVGEEVERQRESFRKDAIRASGRAGEELEALKAKLATLAERTGLDVLGWVPVDEQVSALKFALSSDAMARFNGLPSVIDQMERATKLAKELHAKVRGAA